MGRKCIFCGQSIEHRPFQARYCNDAHRSKANRRKKDPLVGSNERRLNQQDALSAKLSLDEIRADLRDSGIMGQAHDSWNDTGPGDFDAPAVQRRRTVDDYYEWMPPNDRDTNNPLYENAVRWNELYNGLKVSGWVDVPVREHVSSRKFITETLRPSFLGLNDLELQKEYERHRTVVNREANRRRGREDALRAERDAKSDASIRASLPREAKAPQVPGSALPDPQGTTNYFKAERLTLPLANPLSTSTLEGVNVTEPVSDVDAVRSSD